MRGPRSLGDLQYFAAGSRGAREDRQAILNHYNGDITTHYSVAKIGYMLEQMEKPVTLVHKPSFYLVRAEAKGPNTDQLEKRIGRIGKC